MILGLPLIAGPLRFDCYPPTPQALINEAFAVGAAQATGLTGMIVSDTTPGPEDQDKAWFKTSTDFPVMVFKFAGGQWLARHLSSANGNELRMWDGDEATLNLYDGGDAGPPGQASGPMWQIDHAFDGRSPIGPGTIPGSATIALVATNYGSAQHTLTVDEMPAHSHALSYDAFQYAADGTTFPGKWPGTTTPLGVTGNTGGGVPFEHIAPTRGAYVIRRTGRVYYRG